MKKRSWDKWLVIGVVTAAVAAVLLPEDGQRAESVVAARVVQSAKPSTQVAAQDRAPAPSARVELERFSKKTEKKEGKKSAIANAFNSTSWYVPPPPPPPAPPPPPPTPVAPPLPFTYLGRYEDKSKTVVILAKGDQVYTVSDGEVIEGTYRVDQIANGTVNFIYLPLKATQSLDMTGPPDNKQFRPGMAGRNGRP